MIYNVKTFNAEGYAWCSINRYIDQHAAGQKGKVIVYNVLNVFFWMKNKYNLMTCIRQLIKRRVLAINTLIDAENGASYMIYLQLSLTPFGSDLDLKYDK